MSDRIDISHLSEEQPHVDPEASMSKLTPMPDDDEELLKNFGVLVARELVRYMPFFSDKFSDVIVHNIPHPYTEEMKKKSEIVS